MIILITISWMRVYFDDYQLFRLVEMFIVKSEIWILVLMHFNEQF